MKTHFFKTILWSFLLIASSFLFSSSGTPGYDEFGNDIDECALYVPCPDGYTCINTMGSYLCYSPDGEVTGGGTEKGYKIHRNDCHFSETIDGEGYVKLFGIRKFVGFTATGIYEETYRDVLTDCELNGSFLCQPYTCAQFWLNKD